MSRYRQFWMKSFTMTALIGLCAFGGLRGQTVTKTYNPGFSTSFDGTGQYGGSMPAVTFSTADFATGCLITDVNVRITWAKTDGSCAAPGNGNSFHNETSFRIDGPSINVPLASTGTWSGNANIAKRTTVFDQSAGGIPSGTPATGTFLPNGGNLNNYNGTSPVGNWMLRPGDSGGGDPLCVEQYSVQITAGTALASTISAQTNVLCNGASTGSLTAQGSNGTAPYSYTWSNGATTATTSGLAAGTYTVTVTDANNCPSSTSSATITQPATAVSVTANTMQNVDCFGGSNGQINASISGGTGGKTRLWSTGATTPVVNSLVAGTYTITVTDANGCTATSSTTVSQPSSLVASASVTSVLDCFGDTDGEVTASETGGTPGYTYSWNTGETNSIENSIGANTYSVTVTDANGCTDSSTVTLTQPTDLVASSSVTQTLDCFGDTDGEVTVSETGGTPGYTYNWNTGETNAIEDNIGANTYSVTVTDANGCTDSSTVTLTQPTLLVASASVSQSLACNGDVDGEVTVSPSGGTAGYTYSWNTGETNATETNLAPGTYSVTVTDANGCTDSASVTLAEPALLVASASVSSIIDCNGDNDGQVTATPSGGTSGYTYSWNTGETNATETSLGPGTYSVTITDANGCTDSASVTLTEPTVLVASSSVTQTLDCFGDTDGEVTASETGGTPGYTYSWNTGETNSIENSIGANTYSVTVTDANGCTDSSTVTLTQPTDLVASSSVTQTLDCFGDTDGEVTVSETGGTPGYTYNWNTGETNAIEDNIGANTYSVTVTDANGCTDSSTVTLTQPTLLVASASVSQSLACNGDVDGEVTVSPSGGTAGYTYSWNTGETNATETNLAPGTYSVTVTDANGCTDSASVTLAEPALLVASASVSSIIDCNGDNDGQVTATQSGGTAGYTYNWNTGETNATETNLGPGTYSVTITDANGCTDSASVTLTEPTVLVASVTVDSGETCFGANDGGLTAVASGGTSGYTYSWSNAAVTSSMNDGAGTYSVTITDANGCTDSSSATIQALDVTPPVALARDLDIHLDLNGDYVLDPLEVDSGSSDNCSITSYSLSQTVFDCNDVGSVITVTLTVLDGFGNADSATGEMTVLDTTPPVIVTQPITVVLDASGNDTINAAQLDNGTDDNCDIGKIFLGDSLFTCQDVGLNTVTFYAQDIHGNLDSALVNVTVQELVSPSAVPNDTALFLDSFGLVSVTASEIDSASFDNCGIDTIWLSKYTFDCGDVGVNTITFYVQDVGGNIDSADAQVSVSDTISPTVFLQDITVELDSFGLVTIDSNAFDSASWDSCGIQSYSISLSDYDCDDVGAPILVITTIVDVNGNVNTGQAFVTVEDNIAPTVFTRDLTIALDSFGNASITAAQVDSFKFDGCAIDTVFLDQTTFDCNSVGIDTVQLSVTDEHGNTGTADAYITVIDTIAPVLFLRDITVYLSNAGTYSLAGGELDSASWDSCGIASIALDTSNFTCADTGEFPVTLTFTDVNSNVSVGTAMVTLSDTTRPVMATQNITIYLDTAGEASITAAMIDVGTSDNCELDTVFLDSTDLNFTCDDTTSQTVTLRARDISGNTNTEAATVTILDTVRPTVVTQNLIRYLDASGEVNISPIEFDGGSTDNCSIDSRSLSDTLFTCGDTATPLTVTLFVRDVSGNVDSNTATLQVFDTLPPVVIAQNVLLSLDSTGNATLTPAQMDNSSTDNCAIASQSVSQSDFSCADVGNTITVYLSMTDVSGNTAIDSADITIQDTIAPQVFTQNITIYLDSSGEATIAPFMIDSSSSDACGIDTMYLDQFVFSCGDTGLNTVTLTVEDSNGNIQSGTAVVTVFDTIAPTIVLQSITVYLDSFGLAIIAADTLNAATSDNCEVASISIDSSNFSCASHGDTITILFTATDISSNTSLDSVEVYILDTLPPVISAISDTIYLDTSGQFTVDYNSLNNGTADNCTLGEMYLSDSIFDCSAVDSTTSIWYIASDSFGNTDSLLVSITILDTINPEIVCLDTISFNNDLGECGAVVNYTLPTATDNCSIDSIVNLDPSAFDTGSFFPVGFTELTYVALDQSGNSDTCSFIIEVIDTQAPVLTCLADTMICDSTFEFELPTYVDNCAGLSVIQIAGIDSGDFYPVGLTVNTFTITDLYGNSDTCSFEVFRYDFPSLANAGEDQDLCEATSAQLTANQPSVGAGVWKLIVDTATISDSNAANTSVSGLTLGETSFNWTISNGVCPVERDTIVVRNFSNDAEVNAGLDVIVCDSNGAQLQASEANVGFGYWSHDNEGVTLSDSSITNPTVSGLELGQYEFTWTIENGVCPFSPDRMTVFVEPNPVATASGDEYIFPPTQIEISVTSDIGASFEWFPKTSIFDDNLATPMVNPTLTQEYYVVATTDAGCTDVDSLTVFVNPDLGIPTAFTPDGDNTNDIWNIRELANYPDCNVSVYNRWGDRIFESKGGYEIPWDGSFRGSPLPGGAYFFVIELGTNDINPITGSVTIIK